MSTAETQYFTLLRAALWNAPLAFDAPIDWKGVMRIAEHHCNDVLLSDLAFRMDEAFRPSAQVLAHMKSEMRSNLFNQMKLKQILVPAVRLLREHDVEPVLLKGFGLSLLYPNPGLRQFGDIDLYVGHRQFHEACTLLRCLPGCYNWGEETEVGRHYNIEFGHHPMEVHRVSADIEDPKKQLSYDAIEQDGLAEHSQHTDLDGFSLTVPSKEFVVFFTFFHAWEHFMTTGVGWRQLTDVSMALHAYYGQLDLDKLHRWLVAMQLMEPWQTFGWLIVTYLGLPEAEMPFYGVPHRRVADRLYGRIMTEGNFKRSNKYKLSKPKGRLAGKLHSFVGIFVDFFLLARFFPRQAVGKILTALRNAFAKNLSNEKK